MIPVCAQIHINIYLLNAYSINLTLPDVSVEHLTCSHAWRCSLEAERRQGIPANRALILSYLIIVDDLNRIVSIYIEYYLYHIRTYLTKLLLIAASKLTLMFEEHVHLLRNPLQLSTLTAWPRAESPAIQSPENPADPHAFKVTLQNSRNMQKQKI